ncbi:ketopantoate reductase family protein [Bacilliculturomica massiliensis]|uniref:ketopantoate reductase family protein n=1 Tax=Bacilliculturomica massiliensis TaxID=1917867 RepID=UPI0010310A35|nr:ketopantoate reductase family protein [Bacilliculturomica massiliensis]
MRRIEKVAIIGLGALGVVYGQKFTERLGRENVFFVADRDRIRRYEKDEVFCNDVKCDFRYVDKDDCGAEKADLVVFAVKYTALEEAIDSVKHVVGDHTLIISVLNGIVSERDIAAVYGSEKVLYCIAQATDAMKEGNRFYYQNEGVLQVGTGTGERDERLKAVTDLFDRTRIPYLVPEDIMHQLWNKLMLNVGVNQVVAVFETNYGGIQHPGKERELMKEAMREVRDVAAFEGVTLTEEEITQWLNVLDALAPESMPSLRQDTKAHRMTEVELFSGTIRRLGRQYGVPTPVNDFLYQRIREIESEYDRAGC